MHVVDVYDPIYDEYELFAEGSSSSAGIRGDSVFVEVDGVDVGELSPLGALELRDVLDEIVKLLRRNGAFDEEENE